MISEDFAGRMLIVFFATMLTMLSAVSLFVHLQKGSAVSSLAAITMMASVIFLSLQVLMTVRRLPPKATAGGIEPRLTSIAASSIMLVAMLLTEAFDSEAVQIAALSLIFLGTVSSVFCLYWLGRSFSIMATARRLVTTGPYAIVRHPLYVCEAIFVVGMVISHLSIPMILVGAVQFMLQYRRVVNEEAILRQTFPEYGEYAKRVPMLLPWPLSTGTVASNREV